MKLIFDPPHDGKTHVYCLACYSEAVVCQHSTYHCTDCGHNDKRALIIDPSVVWWIDARQEYWHESAGVFVRDGDKFLFFNRVKPPFGLTVPAGHREKGENPKITALRELREETRLKASRVYPVATCDISIDSCRRGADAHRWHIYTTTLPPRSRIKIDSSEGNRPVWLTLDEALRRDLTPAVRYIIERYANHIRRV